MSGGVDSAMAAALLQEAGHEVIAVTLQLADLSAHGLGVSRCCSPADVATARAVAAFLAIPHYVLDMEHEFREAVLDPFVHAYLDGETPLPCARCNSRIKLGELMRVAHTFGAEALATGHYARIEDDGGRPPALRRGRDRAKDQSYFLFDVDAARLRHTLFPVGDLTKGEVRRKAVALGLPNAERRESQEVCFVPRGGSYVGVVEKLAPGRLPGEGEIVDREGTVLGRHAGFHRFTVGQRHGIGVADRHRLYVVALQPGHNRVVVGRREEALRRTLVLREATWLAPPDGEEFEALVQVRSRHEPVAASVALRAGRAAVVEFSEPVLAPAPGQAAVCYDGDRVLGGGWIAETA
jgi:tRNA-specific 2-thiouridylase